MVFTEHGAPKEQEHLARMHAASRIIREYDTNIKSVFGTTMHAGSNPRRWKPFHVGIEGAVQGIAVGKIFLAACASGEQLDREDLPGMMVAQSLVYPDFDNLYGSSVVVAHDHMRQANVFRERDFDLVAVCIATRKLRQTEDAQPILMPIADTDPFVMEKKIIRDALLAPNSSNHNSLWLLSLLIVENLIQSRQIKTREGRVPHSLREVIESETTYDEAIVRDGINLMQEIYFSDTFLNTGRPYEPELSSTKRIFPYYAANKSYCESHLVSQIAFSQPLSLRDLLHDTRQFSQELLPNS